MSIAKVKKLKKADFVGETVPPKFYGMAGRHIENRLEEVGYKVSKKQGIDLPVEKVETKTRDLDSVSPETIATMSEKEILSTNYEDSKVCEKFQQQFRVYTKDRVIVSNEIHDYSDDWCQKIAKDIYDIGKDALAKGVKGTYISGTKFGYWESKKPGMWDFRFRKDTYNILDRMVQSKKHFDSMFEVPK